MPGWYLDAEQTLRWTLLSSLWLATVVMTPSLLFRFVGGQQKRGYPHAVGQAGLLSFLVGIPILMVLLNFAARPRLVVNNPVADQAWLPSLMHRLGGASMSAPDVSALDTITACIVVGWGLGAFARLIKLTRDYLRVQRLYSTARPIAIEAALGPLPEALTKQFGRSGARIVLSNQITQPSTGGVWRPFIALPERLVELLSLQELSAIVAHEVAHIERHDALKNLSLQIVGSVFWFNPAFHYLLRSYEHGRELACDRMAVAYGAAPTDLASALAKVSIFEQPPEALSVLSTGGSILERMKALVDAPAPKARWPRTWASLSAAIVLLSLGLGVTSARAAADVWIRLQARTNYLTQTNQLDLDVLTYDVCSLLNREQVFDSGDYGIADGPVTLTFDDDVIILNGAPLPPRIQLALTHVLDKHSVKQRDENFFRFFQSDSELGVQSGAGRFGERIGTGRWLRTTTGVSD